MLIESCYVTNTGKVREINEDCLLLNETLITGSMSGVGSLRAEGEKLIYMVADGMGGHARGEAASSSVLTVFKENCRHLDTAKHIDEVVRLARQRLNRLVEKDRSSFGLGTTVSGMFFSDSKAFLINCGDSRVYQSGESLRKITKDHSVVQELVDSGLITEEEMRTHPQKNIVTSAFMGDLKSSPPVYSLDEIRVAKGQEFLLCTDGMWESLDDRAMAACLRGKSIEEGAECLFRSALDAGATDNVSFILLEVSDI